MATEQHIRLSNIVKETHALLRAEYQRYGADAAWERHVSRNDVLQVRPKSPRFLTFLTFPRYTYPYCFSHFFSLSLSILSPDINL